MMIQVSLSIMHYFTRLILKFSARRTQFTIDSCKICFQKKNNIYFFFLPLFFNASAIIHCSCPLTDRNSSAAHFSTASIVSASTRSRKVLVFVLFSFSFAIINSSLSLTRDFETRDFGTKCVGPSRSPAVSQSRVLVLS